jgi:hypothetical protein
MTKVYISHITRSNIDIDPFFISIQKNNILYIQHDNDSTNWIKFDINDIPTIISNSYIEIPVTILSFGTGTFFPNNLGIYFSIFSTSVPTNPFNQNLNTGDNVQFNTVTLAQLLPISDYESTSKQYVDNKVGAIALTNSGSGSTLLNSTTNPNFSTKGLIAGSNISITSTASDLTISAAASTVTNLQQATDASFLTGNPAVVGIEYNKFIRFNTNDDDTILNLIAGNDLSNDYKIEADRADIINLNSTISNSGSFVKSGGTNQQYLMADGTSLEYSANSGNSNFYLYNSIDGITTPPPASGKIGYNNTNQSLATILYINHLTSDGIDIDVFFAQLTSIQDVYLQDKNSALNFIKYNITGAPTIIANSYISIPVLYTSPNGGGTGLTSFGVNYPIIVSFFTNSIDVDLRLTDLESKTQYQTSASGSTNFSGSLGITSTNGFRLSPATTDILLANGTSISQSSLVGPYLPKAGGTMTGDIAIGTNNITGTTGLIQGFNIPTLNTNITTAQTTATNALPKAGGTMTGLLTLASTNNVSGSIIPSADTLYSIGDATGNQYGIGNFRTALRCPVLDTNTAVSLNIGTFNPSTINIGRTLITTQILGTTNINSVYTLPNTAPAVGQVMTCGTLGVANWITPTANSFSSVYPFPTSIRTGTIGPGGTRTLCCTYTMTSNITFTTASVFFPTPGTDVNRVGIYRGDLTTATLVGQTTSNAPSSDYVTRTLTVIAGQSLTFTIGQQISVAMAINGGSSTIATTTGPSNIALAFTSTISYSAAGFPTLISNITPKAATTVRQCMDLL